MIRKLLAGLIRIYQWCFSSWLGRCCRFYPSCSEYTRIAILWHGAGRGVILGAKRICRCHPFSPGGYDPVPPRPAAHHQSPIADSRSEIGNRKLEMA